MRHGSWIAVFVLLGAALWGGRLYLQRNEHGRVRVERVGSIQQTRHKPSAPRSRAMPQLQPRELEPTTASTSSPVTVDSNAAVPVAPSREQRIFEMQQDYDNDLAGDRRSMQIMTEIRGELLRALEAHSRLESVECKLSRCRAILSYPNIEADKESVKKLLQPMEGPFARFGFRAEHETAPDGSVKLTLFVKLS